MAKRIKDIKVTEHDNENTEVDESELNGGARLPEDKTSDDAAEIVKIMRWKDRCDNIMARLLDAKENRGRWNQECGKLQREFDALYNKGWIAMTQETPLFDGIEEETQADPDAWKDILIADADMKASLKKKLNEHWTTLGELSEWVGLAFPPKMKGIGPKVKDEIAEWFDAFHAPAMEAELERIRSGQEEEEQTESGTEENCDEYSIDEDDPEPYEGQELDEEVYDEDDDIDE